MSACRIIRVTLVNRQTVVHLGIHNTCVEMIYKSQVQSFGHSAGKLCPLAALPGEFDGGSGGTEVPTQPKPPRKPYTVTRKRETWTEEEHTKFVEAVRLYNRDWKKVEAHVSTKTVVQVRDFSFVGVVPNSTDIIKNLRVVWVSNSQEKNLLQTSQHCQQESFIPI